MPAYAQTNAAKSPPVGDSPEDFSEFSKTEIEKWNRIVHEPGLKVN